MLPPKKILVPVDADVDADRDLARNLVDAAADLANAFDARVRLVHVAPPVAMLGAEQSSASYRAMLEVLEQKNVAAQHTLDALKTRLTDRALACDSELLTEAGSVPEIVVRAAQHYDADLIVVASHGRRGVARIVLGSVAERTAHLSPIPVLLLPPG
ncbi:MAG TPA: universal stress protein [Myxococcota bacterium]|jgi:nucleotide-binding universal stress UspA family protein